MASREAKTTRHIHNLTKQSIIPSHMTAGYKQDVIAEHRVIITDEAVDTKVNTVQVVEILLKKLIFRF